MIEFTKSFKTEDNKIFATIEEAQIHELEVALSLDSDIVKQIVDNKDAVMDILTTTKNSKPKARKINGGNKKRKTVITDANTNIITNVNVVE